MLENLSVRRVKSKDSDPGDQALVHPWKEGLIDLADFKLLLEYWSVGVLRESQVHCAQS